MACQGMKHTWEINEKLTQWERAILKKLMVIQLAKKFSAFCGTQKFITVFIRARHWSVS